MSIIEEILREFSSTNKKYGGMSVNLFGIPNFKSYSKRTLRTSFDRLVKNEMIKKELNGFILTAKGKKYLKKKEDSFKTFSLLIKSDEPKNLIVMFDMPIAQKAEREWFRFHLKKFDYVMIQKSVWVGPSPLPKDFLDYLKEIKLKDCVVTFKLAKPYKVKKN
ncbi:MAG: hypothetical protein NTW62_01305 [Candidatus Nomurabacteria bacterium]|nr:hypothetical protein [Candidatus Nomurabacteria bacterium]